MRLEKNKSLSSLSTFGIGGPARYFTSVKTIEELCQALTWAQDYQLAVWVVGRGSNSLFDDRGFNGLVIHHNIAFCRFKDTQIDVGGGYSFSILGTQTARRGLSGLEFAAGIPGSVGGAIFMNAGANGSEAADCLLSLRVVNREGNVYDLKRSDLHFGYRTSSLHDTDEIVAAATFQLMPSLDARKRQLEMIMRRSQTQPYKNQSCGCIFRNPEGDFAGRLIEVCGIKGMRKGNAEVSLIHGNFIVNRGEATAEEVVTLAEEVRRVVLEKTGIQLEWELRKVPYEFSS